jgi:NTE family protein
MDAPVSETPTSTDLAEFLGVHPFFALLTAQLRRWLAGRIRLSRVLAGEYLTHQGDEADAMYLMISGRLELTRGTGAGAVVEGSVGPGGSVGESGVLTGEGHVLTARAVRDSEVLVIDRALVLSLVQESRVFRSALLEFLGERLTQSQGPPDRSRKRTVFTILPMDPSSGATALREGLVAQLRQWGSVGVLEAPGPDSTDDESESSRRLCALEEEFEFVVLSAATPSLSDGWTRFCVRQADRVVAVVGRDRVPGGLDLAALRGFDIAFSDGAIDPAIRNEWLGAIEPRTHYHVGDPAALSAMARRLTGRSVGLVLSGGGARGLAHIGVIQALVESHIPIDRVGGTSMGAFVGGLIAKGCSPAEIKEQFQRELVERRPFNDFTIPIVSLARGRRARGMMDRLFGDVVIEDLPLDFFCITADLVSGRELVHRRGPVWMNVGASMSIPGFAPPVRVGEQVLVDGGVLNNFPIDIMKAMDEGPIIGVDAMAPPKVDEAFGDAANRPELHLPNIGETLSGAATLGSRRRGDENALLAALVIRPEVSKAGLLEFSKLDELFEIGRHAMLDALDLQGAGQFV